MPTLPTTFSGQSQTINLGSKYNPSGQVNNLFLPAECERGGEYFVYRKKWVKLKDRVGWRVREGDS